MLYLLPALALVATGVPAIASQQTSPSTSTAEENGGTPPPAKARKPRKICREDPSANSRMPTRTCHTQEEWDALAGRQSGNRDIPSRATH
jgi:hypothetical protein